MFEWLEKEIADIKTRKFHIVDGPADETLRHAVESCGLGVPQSYKNFVLQFGNAKLYRVLSYYKVGVLASPREERLMKNGDIVYRIGHYDSNSAYLKEVLLRNGGETPVFEGGEENMRQVADGFESWLTKRCAAARAKYNKRQWAELMAGPLPFSPYESSIMEARRRFTCQAIRATPQAKLFLEVHNGSTMTLPFLSVGVRTKDYQMEGGFRLPVSQIGPGETAVVEQQGYSGMVDLAGIEVFMLPDPGPEDRERYWEFKAASR